MTTISDVARRAGVTTATVSNVITQRVTVSEKTRERVQKAIEELDYRPNLLARGLAQGKTMMLALIIPTISNPFFAEIAEEVERVADQHSYQLLLGMTHNDADEGRRHLERMASRWVDGFIVMSMAANEVDVLAVAERGKPVVLSAWNQDSSVYGLPMINVDFRMAGRLATQHLLDCGHRCIAAILDKAVQKMRLAGYLETLAAAGLSPCEEYVCSGESSFESGYRGALELLSLPVPPTAIFAGNDWMAHGAVEAITSRGLAVPRDLSIVGVDDISLASYGHVPLTTVSIPKQELARITVEMLLRCLDGAREPEEPSKIVIDPHLVIRQSTARLR